MTHTVCIVGLSPTSRDRVFKEPPGTEMWSVNTGHFCFTLEQMLRFTAWFQVHPRREFEMANAKRPEHLEWLRACKIPLYMEETWPDIPASVKYPRAEVVKDIGTNYFTSSIAYMVALAIYLKYDEIRFYGVDMPSQTEYVCERPCVEFLLGIAHSRGIKIIVPEDCPLMRGQRYAETVTISSTLLKEKINGHIRNRDQKLADYNEACGMVKALEELGGRYQEVDLARYQDDACAQLLAQKRKMRDQVGAEYNAYAGGVQALTELYIDALRPEHEEQQKLRSIAGELLV